jgi:hypothetical protein
MANTLSANAGKRGCSARSKQEIQRISPVIFAGHDWVKSTGCRELRYMSGINQQQESNFCQGKIFTLKGGTPGSADVHIDQRLAGQ